MSLAHLGHDTLRDMSADEFDPRGSDICPQCGSGHTSTLPLWVDGAGYDDPIHVLRYWCDECDSTWEVEQYTPETWARILPYRNLPTNP